MASPNLLLSTISLTLLLLSLTLLSSSSPLQDPELVVQEVHQKINGSRRNLGYLSCGTGNPIDDCWRCDPNWEKNRQRLADCAIGFGKDAIGGRDGRIYVVTDSGDYDVVNPKPGTLRHAVIQDEPLWIVFARDMVIKLKEELIMNSFKTIDGRGASGNRFLAPNNDNSKEVTKHEDAPMSEWKNWNWRSEGDLLLNGAFFTPSGAGASSSYARASSLGARPSTLVSSLTMGAGALNCRKGSRC
ncbi:hypothetical protein Scep_018021 [Stephania cephalantha]|uniref:Pectate lyase n=1 Tax=Stephania cephalantha TaxID=152367 RepID=A0AAP0IRZ7_9MAGN